MSVSSGAPMAGPLVAGRLPAGVTLTPLRRIAHPLGDVVHGMKAGDEGFAGFGEAYFSHVLGGATKGWKRHRHMVLNLLVPAGTVDFHLHDEAAGSGATARIDAHSPARLTVPPGLWMAFSAVGGAPALVLNLASLPHDPAEADTAPLERFARVPWEMVWTPPTRVAETIEVRRG